MSNTVSGRVSGNSGVSDKVSGTFSKKRKKKKQKSVTSDTRVSTSVLKAPKRVQKGPSAPFGHFEEDIKTLVETIVSLLTRFFNVSHICQTPFRHPGIAGHSSRHGFGALGCGFPMLIRYLKTPRVEVCSCSLFVRYFVAILFWPWLRLSPVFLSSFRVG